MIYSLELDPEYIRVGRSEWRSELRDNTADTKTRVIAYICRSDCDITVADLRSEPLPSKEPEK